MDDHFVEYASRSLSSDNGSIHSVEGGSLSSVESESPYDVPELEAHLYYAGLSGPSGGGPKLVYRTSKEKEVFTLPTGPEAYPRLMKLVGVPVSHKLGDDLGKNRLWDIVREEVSGILKHSAICGLTQHLFLGCETT